MKVKFDNGPWRDTVGSSNGYAWFDCGDVGAFNKLHVEGTNNGGAYLGGIEVNGVVLTDAHEATGGANAADSGASPNKVDLTLSGGAALLGAAVEERAKATETFSNALEFSEKRV